MNEILTWLLLVAITYYAIYRLLKLAAEHGGF